MSWADLALVFVSPASTAHPHICIHPPIYDVLSDHKEIMKFSFIAELDCFISAQQDLSNTLKGEQIKHYE